MKILLISFGVLEYDGRLRNLISVFSKIGEVYAFTRGNELLSKHGKVCNVPYIRFVISAINYARKFEQIDLLVLDNRKATIPGLLIKFFLNPNIIIQDCRELYLFNEVNYLVGKIGCIFEELMARMADIVICANQERAVIMKQKYDLMKLPIVYENLRKLAYSSEEAKNNAKKKFAPYIKEDEIRIISSSGCSIKRTNDVLVQNLKNVSKKCRLFLVGNSDIFDEKRIKELSALDTNNVVTILGRLNQTELKYLISRCHIGIVNYGQYDTNNIYCASGKLYEFVYEGVPVVTTTNPPLKRLCDEHGIGVADDQYATAINKVLHDYNFYKENVLKFASDNTVQDNDSKLIKKLKMLINLN